MKPELKIRLIEQLIQTEDDEVLSQIQEILEGKDVFAKKGNLNSTLKEKLTERALKSLEDIKEGRLLSRDEMERETDDLL
jgi:hypothetical protein